MLRILLWFRLGVCSYRTGEFFFHWFLHYDAFSCCRNVYIAGSIHAMHFLHFQWFPYVYFNTVVNASLPLPPLPPFTFILRFLWASLFPLLPSSELRGEHFNKYHKSNLIYFISHSRAIRNKVRDVRILLQRKVIEGGLYYITNITSLGKAVLYDGI